MHKVENKQNTITGLICSDTLKKTKWRQRFRSGVSIANFEHISYFFPVI